MMVKNVRAPTFQLRPLHWRRNGARFENRSPIMHPRVSSRVASAKESDLVPPSPCPNPSLAFGRRWWVRGLGGGHRDERAEGGYRQVSGSSGEVRRGWGVGACRLCWAAGARKRLGGWAVGRLQIR